MKITDDKLFTEKDGKDPGLDPIITEKIKDRVRNGRLPCAVAFEIANSLEIKPGNIGKMADIMGISLSECQLGLFGHRPDKKIVGPENTENLDLLDSIRKFSREKSLSCGAAWRIAKLFHASKLTISNICEANGIKIKRCQLGAF